MDTVRVVHPYLVAPGPVAIAHRGGGGASRAAGTGGENTVEAFHAAVAMGYHHLETDARATSDGVAVAFHDASLERMTGDRRLVRSLRWADLCTIRVGGACAVPRLDDLLSTFPGVRFPIDVKEGGAVAPAAAAVTRTAAIARVCIGSFSDRRLAATVALLGPDACFSLGPRGVMSLMRAAHLRGRFRTTALCAQVPASLRGLPVCTRRLVETGHRNGLLVYVWTVNAADHMRRLLDMGVDGVVTDELSTLLSVLADR